MRERVGIYGGTFDPPHNGHIRAAELFLKQMSLDRLLIMPSFLPPHKQQRHTARADQRLHMAHLAFSHLPATEISDLEIVRGGVSYTADTLRSLSDGERELFLLVGTDMFLTLDTWRDPPTIFRLATVCLIRRESEAQTECLIDERRRLFEARFGARIAVLDAPALVVSSSDVRAGACEEQLPSAVRTFIEREGLYRDGHA